MAPDITPFPYAADHVLSPHFRHRPHLQHECPFFRAVWTAWRHKPSATWKSSAWTTVRLSGSGGIVRKYASRRQPVPPDYTGKFRQGGSPQRGESGQPQRLTWVLRIRMTRLSRTCTNGYTGLAEETGQTWSNVPIPPSFRLKAKNRAEWLRKNSFMLKTPPATASLRRKEKYSGSSGRQDHRRRRSKRFRRLSCRTAPLEVRLLLPSPAEKTHFTFPGPSPAAAASPSPLKNSTTTGWAALNSFLVAQPESGNPARKLLRHIRDAYQGKTPGRGSGSNRTAYTNVSSLCFFRTVNARRAAQALGGTLAGGGHHFRTHLRDSQGTAGLP